MQQTYMQNYQHIICVLLKLQNLSKYSCSTVGSYSTHRHSKKGSLYKILEKKT